jgi:serine/threonine-protein kinase
MARAVPDPLLGVTVDDRYEVLAVIGEGGMGRVYRVRHRRLGRSFALKALRLELAREPSLADRFIQEARAAAVVSHPNVVQINDFGTLHSGQPYFVMELLEGRTLARIIKEEGPIEPVRCLSIARQIAEAIAAAHAMGVIHRDLKPDNVILVRPSGSHTTVKVLDFGLARVAGSARLTRPGVVFGTPYYMSPEQAGGDPFDHRVDVYALGIIMFEMLTGRVPFEADTQMGVLSKHLYQEPPKLPDFTLPVIGKPGLQEVIAGCLAKKVDDRWASMTELARRLNSLCLEASNQESAVTGTMPFETAELQAPTKSTKTRLLRSIVLGSMVTLLLVLGFAWALNSRRAATSAPLAAAGSSGVSAMSVAPSAKSPPADLSGSAAASEPPLAAKPAAAATSASPSAAAPPSAAAARPSPRRPGPRETAVIQKRPNKPGLGTGEIADPWAK